ncbi:ribonuclease H family protein [Sinorhizobium meliloti]|uniref:ribonuclease H family protein n=1 Tax=Rhizobium meliloti TaxID=382 RepID=UPI000FE0FD13|nr:ribonuclease H [Sinorhizobium meliloti]RVO67047.1 ribonuclease HI [Sinorhizobium meliloti]
MAKWQKFRKPRSAGAVRHEIDHAVFAAGLHVFGDGACDPNPGPGGWGVAVFRDGVEIAFDYGGEASTTNNRMELTGLLKGIEAAKALQSPATLWCDSEYAVKGANVWMHNWKKRGWKKPGKDELKNIELWQSIDAALSGADQIIIRWCKGHAGIAGNERADELSNLGLASALQI